MAGHSQFANIKHRKGAQDAKKAKLFTKLVREIIIATSKGQPDPEFNPRLRNAIYAARKAGVTKDRIETAIKKGSGEIAGENYEEMRYEGYAPGGVALIVMALTNNKNRSASDIRSCFTKSGGTMGETGSVGFMFDYVGFIEYALDIADFETIFEAAVDFGADNVESNDNFYEITCVPDQFAALRDGLQAKFGDMENAKLMWRPKDPTAIDFEQAEKILKLVDMLEDLDDVQDVIGNFTVSDEILEKLSQ